MFKPLGNTGSRIQWKVKSGHLFPQFYTELQDLETLKHCSVIYISLNVTTVVFLVGPARRNEELWWPPMLELCQLQLQQRSCAATCWWCVSSQTRTSISSSVCLNSTQKQHISGVGDKQPLLVLQHLSTTNHSFMVTCEGAGLMIAQ